MVDESLAPLIGLTEDEAVKKLQKADFPDWRVFQDGEKRTNSNFIYCRANLILNKDKKVKFAYLG